MRLTNYNYYLPPGLIVQVPAVPRDSSRLFVYNTQTGKITFDHFYDLYKYLPEKSFLVLNKTKVIPARVTLKKESGGKVICLLLFNELSTFAKASADKTNSRIIKTLVDRRINIGDKLFIDKNHFFDVVDQKEKIFYLKSSAPIDWVIQRLTKIGRTPVPLYLRRTPLSEKDLRKKYQTIFSFTPDGCRQGSVAAPTASLHFTNRVFANLEKKGTKKLFVTLHVGLGTFAPITEENIKNKKLHEEFYEIDQRTLQLINQSKCEGKKLVAVGTTVVRTLEAFANLKLKSQKSKPQEKSQKDGGKCNFFRFRGPAFLRGDSRAIKNCVAESFYKTDLFIMPPYDFKMVDHLITNFHLPNSSLMMLVEAFLQYKKSKHTLVDLYNIAIKEKFRFYSFGDAMLVT